MKKTYLTANNANFDLLDASRFYTQDIYEIGTFRFHSESKKLSHKTAHQNLTNFESRVLKILLENRNKFVDRNELLEEVWGYATYYTSRSLDVYMTRLRKYFRKDQNVKFHTVYGKGFKLVIN